MDFNIIIVAIISLGTPILLYFQNRSTNSRLQRNDNNVIALEKEKLDGLVLDRARTLYEGMIAQLEAQAVKLRATIDSLEKDLDEEREDNIRLRLKIREFELRVAELESQISQLKTSLQKLNISE